MQNQPVRSLHAQPGSGALQVKLQAGLADRLLSRKISVMDAGRLP